MGFIASYARVMMLTMEKNYIEFDVMSITIEKQYLMTQMNTHVEKLTGDLDAGSIARVALQNQLNKLQSIDSLLDLKLKRLNTKLQATETELQSADKMLQQEIKRSFSYGGGGGQ